MIDPKISRCFEYNWHIWPILWSEELVPFGTPIWLFHVVSQIFPQKRRGATFHKLRDHVIVESSIQLQWVMGPPFVAMPSLNHQRLPLWSGGWGRCAFFFRILFGGNDRLLFRPVGVDGKFWWQDPGHLLDFPRERALPAEEKNASNG